jgi:hypothetical protein
MASLDIVCSVLRLPYGTPAEADYDKLDQALIQVDKIWKEFDLSYTPKYHGLDTHAAAQMKRIGGFGDMLEDDLEKSHQDCDRFGQRVARLKSAPLKAAAFSHHERTVNDPKVQATRAAVIARTTRKRKEAGPTKISSGTVTISGNIAFDVLTVMESLEVTLAFDYSYANFVILVNGTVTAFP